MTEKQKDYSVRDLKIKANDIRVDLIKMLAESGKNTKSGHTAGPLGLADIFTALYFKVLKYDPKNPDWDERDILVLSNGHCTPIRYVTMAHAGYFPISELKTLRQFGSRLQGHPERDRLPGLETTSGPLGSGLSQAAGMALALRMDKVKNRWVYVVMSDGELEEGNSWEAAMLAGKYRLSNVIAIVDRNNIQIDGATEDIMPLENLRAKWEAFGWHVLEVDGNDVEAVVKVYDTAKAITENPVVIIAHTVPGKGVSFMEYNYKWHGIPPGIQDVDGAPPKEKQAEEALKQLEAYGEIIRANMNKWAKIILDALVIGLVLSGLSFFINRADHVNLACVNAPGQVWAPDNSSSPYTEERNGWPFIYYKKIPASSEKCYAPSNADLKYPHSGPQSLFTGYSDFDGLVL